jgi:hypothetical protein
MQTKETQERLETNATHQFPAHTDDMNVSGEIINVLGLKQNTETLLNSHIMVDLEENAAKTQYIYIYVFSRVCGDYMRRVLD